MKRLGKEVREYVSAVVVAFLILTFGFTTVGVAGESMAGESGTSSVGWAAPLSFVASRSWLPVRGASVMSRTEGGTDA